MAASKAPANGDALASTIATAQKSQGRALSAFDLVGSMKDEFQKALPAQIPVEQFMRLAVTELNQNPDLLKCSAASLLGALMTAARLGLEPGGPLGQFYLTPRLLKVKGGEQNEKAWQVVPLIGYKGLIELSRRSGMVGAVGADLVREGDTFRQGFDSRLGGKFTQWEPADYLEARPVIGVLAWANVGSDTQARFLPMEKVLERKARGSAGDSGPWRTDTEAMIRKTGLRALAADLPQSTALALARQVDEQVQRYEAGELVDVTTGELEA